MLSFRLTPQAPFFVLGGVILGEAYIFGLCPICGKPMKLKSFCCEDDTIYFYAECDNCKYTTQEETSDAAILTQLHSPSVDVLKHMLEFCNRNIIFFSTVARHISNCIQSTKEE